MQRAVAGLTSECVRLLGRVYGARVLVVAGSGDNGGDALYAAGRPLILAVDLPSGIDADTGEVTGPAVQADVTVTFGTHKPGLLISPGAEHVGELRFADIGLAPYLDGDPVLEALEHADVEALL